MPVGDTLYYLGNEKKQLFICKTFIHDELPELVCLHVNMCLCVYMEVS